MEKPHAHSYGTSPKQMNWHRICAAWHLPFTKFERSATWLRLKDSRDVSTSLYAGLGRYTAERR